MSVKKNIVYNVSLSVLNVLFPIITAPYVSRVLGVENIGVVRFVINSVNYLTLFAMLGIGYYGVRELAKYKDDQEKCSQIFSSLFTILFCSTFLVTLFFVLSINLIPAFKEHRLLFSLYGITLYLVPISMDWYFQAKEKFRMITIRSLVVRLLCIASLFIFVRERSDILPYVLITVFSAIATQVWNLSYAFKTGLRIKLRNLELSRHTKAMLVFFGSNIAIYTYVMLDTVMLGFLSSYKQVGYYTSANMILDMLIGGFYAVNTVLMPRLSFNRAQNDDHANTALLQKTFDLNALLSVPIAIGLCLVASRFVPFFFGNEFAGSIAPMQVLSFKMILNMLNSFFVVNVLIVFGYEKKFLLVAVCTALLSFALNLLFIPHYGAIGAAIVAIAIGGCFQIGFNLYYVYKFTNVRLRWGAFRIAVLLSLPFFALNYLCNKLIMNDIAFLFIFVSLSAIVYFALQLLAKNYLLRQMIEIGINRLKLKR